MYVVRKPFTSLGHRYSPGDVIHDIGQIKLFRSKLNDRKIIRVPTDSKQIESMKEYFRVKHGVELDLGTEKAKASKPKANGTTRGRTKTAADILAEMKKDKKAR